MSVGHVCDDAYEHQKAWLQASIRVLGTEPPPLQEQSVLFTTEPSR